MKKLARTLIIAATIAVLGAFVVSSAMAQAFSRNGPASSSYDVTHHFEIHPGGNMSPWVWGYWHVYALAVGPESDRAGPHSGWVQIPSVGGTWRVDGTATTSWANADAHSEGRVDAYGAGKPVTGTLHAWGSTFANAPRRQWAEAHAWSASSVTVLGRTKVGRGRILWRPVLRNTVWGQAFSRSVSRARDPIAFEVFDLEGNPLIPKSTVLDIMLNMESPGDENESSVVWGEDNQLAFNVLHDADLSIVIDSPWVTQKGTLKLGVRGGKVSQAVKSGMFDALELPELGSSGVFSLKMPVLELDYDFGIDEEHLVRWELLGGDIIPEPTTVLLFAVGLVPCLRRSRRRTVES